LASAYRATWATAGVRAARLPRTRSRSSKALKDFRGHHHARRKVGTTREEVQVLGDEVKVLTEKFKEEGKAARERADAASARLQKLKHTA
jgi:hypothetical protein